MTKPQPQITFFKTVVASTLTCAMLLLPSGSRATGPIPPSVYTGTYVGATSYAATFNGGVNPHGLPTVYAFQFGTTTGYGAQTAPTSVGTGTTAVKVTQTISNLQPGVTYHVRIVATSSAGTTYGQDVIFVTKAIPLTFTLSATPNPVVYGSSFSVKGTLAGTEPANRQILLQANPFPYYGIFRELSHRTTTSANGSFSFPVANLLANTQLRVAGVGGEFNSPTILEQVAARVSLHMSPTGHLGLMHMYGTVEPSEVGASVSFQLLRNKAAPLNVAWAKASYESRGRSQFSRNVRLRGSGSYRAEVHVFNGVQVSGYSRPLARIIH